VALGQFFHRRLLGIAGICGHFVTFKVTGSKLFWTVSGHTLNIFARMLPMFEKSMIFRIASKRMSEHCSNWQLPSKNTIAINCLSDIKPNKTPGDHAYLGSVTLHPQVFCFNSLSIYTHPVTPCLDLVASCKRLHKFDIYVLQNPDIIEENNIPGCKISRNEGRLGKGSGRRGHLAVWATL